MREVGHNKIVDSNTFDRLHLGGYFNFAKTFRFNHRWITEIIKNLQPPGWSAMDFGVNKRKENSKFESTRDVTSRKTSRFVTEYRVNANFQHCCRRAFEWAERTLWHSSRSFHSIHLDDTIIYESDREAIHTFLSHVTPNNLDWQSYESFRNLTELQKCMLSQSSINI